MIRAHAAAALAQARSTGATFYDVDEVPGNPPTPYGVVSADSGSPSGYRSGSVTASRRVRVAIQLVGDTADEARWLGEKAEQAFLDRPVAVPGRVTTRCRREVDLPIRRDPDAGESFYGLHTYTFTSSPS